MFSYTKINLCYNRTICQEVVRVFFSFFVSIGILTIPIWGIVFCLNLIAIIEKIKYERAYIKNTFWFTLSFVFIITMFIFILTD